ncbi:MAG: hypothetical protein ABII21_02430 [bacterium]
MACPIDLPAGRHGFNLSSPLVMHIDLNSCFASVEQQANPLLRDKPVVVVHAAAPYGCILAPSVEAKLWGVKTGMTLAEGKLLCPWLIARVADPPKYRQIHSQFASFLADYSPHVISKSIDEFVLTLPHVPQRTVPKKNARVQLEQGSPAGEGTVLTEIVKEIKRRIKVEIGGYLRVSIGVSTNQILAKLASGLHKPNGFDIIDSHNFIDIYKSITLQDFCGINVRNEIRLNRVGIFTASQFYSASIQTLKSAFGGILGRYWYTRLRGYEIDDLQFARRSFGQSYVLPHPMEFKDWRPILAKLVSKAARRLRAAGYSASGIHLALRYSDHTYWHASHNTSNLIFNDTDLLTSALALNPPTSQRVKKIAFTCFGLGQEDGQLSYFIDNVKQKSLVTALDSLNDKWGEYTINYGSFLGSQGHVRDAIAFGK